MKTTLRRATRGVLRTSRRIRRRVQGRRANVNCPACGESFDEFVAHRGRPNARCPGCGSLERHRLLWLWLQEQDLFSRPRDVLHVSPEWAISRYFTRNRKARRSHGYVSIDIRPGAADMVADLTDLPFADDAYDLVFCNHVLEHIPNDRKAMRELRRVLRPDGLAILQHPIKREITVEDPAVTDPQERLQRFGQEDHVRIYGRDFSTRLEEAGFTVTVERYRDRLSKETKDRYGLGPNDLATADDLYLCS